MVELGRELWERGLEQVEESHDEGDTAWEIEKCMEIVFQAVTSSSLPGPQQLLWMIDTFLEDQYSLTDSCKKFIQNKAYEQEAHRTQCYGRLVDTFLQSGNHKMAREWCVKGFQKTATSAPGIASDLKEKLRELALREKKFDPVAAYRADDFFNYPSRSNYIDYPNIAGRAQGKTPIDGSP
ncbi:MAG: hypothetical protein KQH63_18865 [Desulfobulbaceae bacterium]|nr:hypothetical protein [Desulfobulbaceae bacterium]